MNGIPQEVSRLIELFNQRRYTECEILARDRTMCVPDEGFAWKMLGAVLKLQGRTTEALDPMKKAAQLWPVDPETHRNLGNLLFELGCFEEAETSLRQAVGLRPDYAEAQANLGNTLRELGKFAEAEAACRRALSTHPNLALAHRSLVLALRCQGKQEEAGDAIRLALERNPDDARLRLLQLTIALPIVPGSETESLDAVNAFDHRLSDLSTWVTASPENRNRFADAAGFDQPFYLAYRPGNHVERLSRYGDLLADGASVSVQASTSPRRKCRLAIVSQYFRSHSVWHIILKGLLTHLDRERFEIILYHTGHDEDAQTEAARSMADLWRDGRTCNGLQGWLQAIEADRPDVMLYPEIGMDPVTLGLAARRLAPLQTASWGHPITTGLPTIDIYFSGDLLEPLEADAHYRERLVRLPGTGCCTVPIEHEAEPVPELAAMLASRTGPLFLIAQLPAKLDPADDVLYARIAEAAGGTFVFFADPKFPWATQRVLSRIGRAFAERGLTPERHLLSIPWLSRPQFYAMLDLCDVYLDCPGFSGYTTAWQAVHRGIPIVTQAGRFLRQRLAAGLLRRMSMTETIAASCDEYVALAVRLGQEAGNAELRNARRGAIRAAANKADHDVNVVRVFEQAVMQAYDQRGTFAPR
jgi:predicted O-linked N-acetylglucosamine transferase (SPINDLY family)